MKPSWKDAPEWANWLAQDSNGKWWWFELEPRPWGEAYFQWVQNYKGGRCSLAGNYIPPFQKEIRPQSNNIGEKND